jgi:IS5 family transposase
MKQTNRPPSLLDEYNKIETLKRYKDPLAILNESIDWESFRTIIERGFKQTEPSKGGRPPFDKVMMFKILILQRYYELSDDSVEFQIVDRWSFMRFLGLSMNDKVPDAKTIWLFRETMIKAGILEELFIRLAKTLKNIGLTVNRGKIVDATIMEAPKQRNTREENRQIKEGKTPEDWQEEKARQKDTDASWLKKDGEDFYGFKNHVVIDSETKLIEDFQVTPAHVPDREIGEEIIETMEEGVILYADRGYPSKDMSDRMKDQGIEDAVMRKGARNKPISHENKERNKIISKTRCRIEHIFGFMKRHKKKFDILSIGLERATGVITLKNIVYNLYRTVKLLSDKGIKSKFAII